MPEQPTSVGACPDAGGPREANSVSNRTALPISEWSEQAFTVPISGVGFENEAAVPIADFPYQDLDRPEDLVREALARGVPMRSIIEGLVRAREDEIGARALMVGLAMIVRTKNWRQTAFALCFACGLANQMGWTQPAVAKKLGVTKEAVNQAIKEVRKELALRKTRTERDAQAKRNMSLSNWRPLKA